MDKADLIKAFSLPPAEAVAYFKAKGFDLPPSFDWRDTWQQAHASGFTVAKSTGFDILGDIQAATLKALEQGQALRDFQRELTPVLQAKGWWGRKGVTDPASGEKVSAQLGSPRRLKIIYDTNLRMAHSAGSWARVERLKESRPYLRYVAIMDGRTRPKHRQWHGTVLPVDDPFWDYAYPPNGWHCRCTAMQLSGRDLERYDFEESESPELEFTAYTNERTGEVSQVPKGIDPGFAYNPGKAAIEAHSARALYGKLPGYPPELAAKAVAASARYALRGLLNDTSAWLGKIGQAIESGSPRVLGERRVVGALSDKVLDYLREQQKIALSSGAISIGDRDATHMLRAIKRDLGIALKLEDLQRIPDILANPKAVLWDKREPGLLYVFDSPSGQGKVVVQVEYGAKVRDAKGKREKIQTNNVRSARYLDDLVKLRNRTWYDLIEGKL